MSLKIHHTPATARPGEKQVRYGGTTSNSTVKPDWCGLAITMPRFQTLLAEIVAVLTAVEGGAFEKCIDVSVNQSKDLTYFSVRDYGSGVQSDQAKKILELFYRSGNELTRTQSGTGIGLALVSELTKSTGGSIELVNRDPGAEFRIFLQARATNLEER